jgi:hypothetical protein
MSSVALDGATIRASARSHILHPTHTPRPLIEGAIDILCQHWGGDREQV